MADSANTYASLTPLLKASYAGPMKTHERPGKEVKFTKLRKKLKNGSKEISKYSK